MSNTENQDLVIRMFRPIEILKFISLATTKKSGKGSDIDASSLILFSRHVRATSVRLVASFHPIRTGNCSSSDELSDDSRSN